MILKIPYVKVKSRLGGVCIATANRLDWILYAFVGSVLLSSYLYAYFEEKSLWDGFWWANITGLTIGYGDEFPVTVGGRLTAIVFAWFNVLGVVPMLIANIVMRMIVNRDAFTHQEQEWQEDSIKRIAEKLGVELATAPRDY